METSQEERILGGLAHLGVIFGFLGVILQVVLLVIYLPKSKYVAGHAKQAIGMWIGWFVFHLVVGLLTGGTSLGFGLNPIGSLGHAFFGAVLLGGLLLLAGFIFVLVVMIMAMIAGFNGRTYRYPLIGNLVASIGGE